MLGKIFLPYLFKSVVGKMQNNMNTQQHNKQPQSKPTGTISVDFVPPEKVKQTKLKDNDDFIPFEEVK